MSKIMKFIGRKLIISSSNKMKLPLNATKKTQAIRAGSLTNLRNILKSNLSLVTQTLTSEKLALNIITYQNKQLKTEQLLNQTFSPKNI